MYRYVALAGAIVLGGLAPAALAQDFPSQPSAMERLIRQEDARWNDPRLGISPDAFERAWKRQAPKAQAAVSAPDAFERAVKRARR